MNTYFTQENINDFIKQISLITDYTLKDRNYSNEAKAFIKLSMIGIVSKYGFDYMKQIFDTLANTKIVYANDSLDTLLKHYGAMDFNNSIAASVESTKKGCVVTNIINNSNSNLYINDIIFISTYKEGQSVNTLDVFIHELNHIINSSKNRYIINNDIINNRTGLCKNIIRKNTGECFYTFGEIFNESINSLQTEEIVNSILSLRGFKIDDIEIRTFLNSIKYPINSQYFSNAYAPIVKIIRPLYTNEYFNIKLTKNLIEGNIDIIQNEFDIIAGDGTYSKLNILIDKYFLSTGDYYIKNDIFNIINTYSEKLASIKKH